MNKTIKKLLISFFITLFFYILIYFVVLYYDHSWETVLWFKNNIYYLIFLFVSIVWGLSLYGNESNKLKLIISIIFLVNFIYLIFIFSISSVWLSQNLGLFLIWFLLLWLVFSNLKNRIGNTVVVISVLGIFFTVFFTIIPMYWEWPDIKGFEDNFKTQIITYSKIGLNENSASLEKDWKEYSLFNWIHNYDFNIWLSWSEIVFKSKSLYPNTFWYILFKNKEILQIYPQTAVRISPELEIEIITGIVKYYPQKIDNFSFTGVNLASLMVDQENINTILDRYNNQLKKHILEKHWKDFYQNRTILLTSKKTLEILNTIFPTQFEKNLENFEMFDEYLDYNLEAQENLDTFDQENIKRWIWQSVKDWINATKVMK